ncbi:MAG: hypothetical protein IPJ89_00375 [Candidatus Iainarchaeum archaeon]|uniref:DNA-directed DNA polymerase n=1 Tax=Candidatus Iainarchaeum sp. TaxID=3101447 RepID=A0A7T9DJW1_9ARCH|nr:MAG: hypothetical protein IPJ89_00375 [Candidatus Diapherotrites archaeon]
MTQKIAVRILSNKKNNEKQEYIPKIVSPYQGVLVFDCETTTDAVQNLKFGSYQYRVNDIIQDIGIFYNPTEVTAEELNYLQTASSQKLIQLYTREQFVAKLADYALKIRALCIGHNLVFDISRLCVGTGYCRGAYNSGFSLKLSENKSIPRIKTTRINERKVLLRFGKALDGTNFGGHFLDTQTLASALLDTKHISLNALAKELGIDEQKLEVEKHGMITPHYIDYNLNDVMLTYLVFAELKKKYEEYGLSLPITKVISGASIGKAFLRKMGIKSFLEQNKTFPMEVLGQCMSAYFGGRCEVKMRKTPVRTTVLDFTSMYPTVCHLMNLQRFMLAKRIDTQKINVQKLLEELTPEKLFDPKTWPSLLILCKIKPNKDCLPVRSDYGGKTLNVGVNYFTSSESFYYWLPDLVYSKFITGKTSVIEEALEFVPVDVQETVKPISVFDVEFNPLKHDFIHNLVLQRNKLKKVNPVQAQGLKILANATSYGIFVELNPEKEPSPLTVYSRKVFETNSIHEQAGEFFNPIVGGLIVSGSRLLLGMIEVELAKIGKTHYACDTDSMFVPPETADYLQEKFQPLSPYQGHIYLHEKQADQTPIYLLKKEYENVWFYGVSSKRYVLFEKKGTKLKILDQKGKKGYKLHGLGYILNPFGKDPDWHKQFWEDGLKLHYNQLSEQDIIAKYGQYYCISQLTVSSWDAYRRFRYFNKGKPFREQIKPFNFMLLGFGQQNDVKPLAPYTKNYQAIVHEPFIDYKTGKTLIGIEYWQNLADVFFNYFNHPEAKMDGTVGLLRLKYVTSDLTAYIGKEGRDIDTQIMRKSPITAVIPQKDLHTYVCMLTKEEAKQLHISRATFYRLKKNPEKLSVAIIQKLLH